MARELRPEVSAFEQAVRMAGARLRDSQIAARDAFNAEISQIALGTPYKAICAERVRLGRIRVAAVRVASMAHTEAMAIAAGRYLAEVDADKIIG
jgi:hypothetical protein